MFDFVFCDMWSLCLILYVVTCAEMNTKVDINAIYELRETITLLSFVLSETLM